MTAQTAILEPIPAHARHLYFDPKPSALFHFTRPLTGGYYWCPPMTGNAVDLSALG